MKWYMLQKRVGAKRGYLMGGYDTELDARGAKNIVMENMDAGRQLDPSLLLYEIGEPFEEVDDYKQAVAVSRYSREFEGAVREFEMYTDGIEDMLPLAE